MIKRIILTAASVVALSAAANAADMYRASAGGYKDGPAYVGVNWSGLYVGVNGGYGSSENSNQLANTNVPFSGLQPEGGFGGGQIGYNVQRGNLVFGVETDFEGANISKSATDAGNNKYSSDLNWFGTVRGRLGYTVDRALVYATGGLAYGNVDNKAIASPSGHVYEANKTDTGYTLGGGVEYKISQAWSLKGEYQYINLGTNDPVWNGVAYSKQSAGVVNDDAYHTFRIGVNYFVGGGYDPLK